MDKDLFYSRLKIKQKEVFENINAIYQRFKLLMEKK